MVDKLRAIPVVFGVRLYTVAIVGRTWTGARVGIGTKTDTTTSLKLDLGLYSNTKVTQVTQRDVIASGGALSTQDLVVGPITPPYAGSALDNDAISVFELPASATPMEIFFNIKGPGFPALGAWFKKIAQNVTGSFRYEFTVTKTAVIP